MSYCEPPMGSVPEQINLQLAAWDTFVVGFVTYEQLPTAAPQAILYEQGVGGPAAGLELSGVSHEFRMPNETHGRHVLPGRGKKEGAYVNTLNYTNVPCTLPPTTTTHNPPPCYPSTTHAWQNRATPLPARLYKPEITESYVVPVQALLLCHRRDVVH